MADNEMLEAQAEEVKTEPEAQVADELGKDGQPFDAERAKALIEKLRQEAKAAKVAEKKLAELEAQEAKRKEADMTELEKAVKRANELEKELQAVAARERRSRIGAEFKLPAEIAELLQGDNDEAMKAHAGKLAAALPKPAPLSPTNPSRDQKTVTEAQRRAFLYGNGEIPQ